MNTARVEVDAAMLDACAREPIHLIGMTQPHGALLVLDARRVIVQASANAVAWLGVDGGILGRAVGDILPGLDDALGAIAADGEQHHLGEVAASDGGRRNVVAHAVSDRVVLDLEPADDRTIPGPTELALLAEAASANALRDDPVGVATGYARLIHAVSGYDRVMVYRFHADDHGEVIAETVTPGTESFLGLHYPASDIPAQARRLFLVNRVRLIVDRDAPVVPLELRDVASEPPLDLSRSALRSSSPIHLEYLRNMGVRATLTAAIRVDGRLWGLIACHHASTKLAPHGLRSLIDLIATLLASRIAELDARRAITAAARASTMQTELLSAFSSEGSSDWMVDVMRQGLVTGVVPCCGAALIAGNSIREVGSTPGEGALRELAKAVAARGPGDVVVIERVGEALPHLRKYAATAASCLAVRIAPEVILLWLRPEWVTTVTWAGDPHKRVTAADGGRLAPRTSFATWTEEVRGTAQPWTMEDLAAAGAVQRSLFGVVDRVYRVRRTLMHSNRRLADFAHMAAHDLQEPLRTIRGFGTLIERKHRESLTPVVADYLTQMTAATERMQWLIRDVLDYASVQNISGEISDVALFDAANEAQVALRQAILETDARVDVAPLPVVRGIHRLLIQLLQNLISNAIKYRGDAEPRILVSAARDDQAGAWRIMVADNGIGIPEQHHLRIFDAFERVGDRAKVAGSGIGLAICKAIAEAHGGSIWVDSAPGSGSTFVFTIPDQIPAVPSMT